MNDASGYYWYQSRPGLYKAEYEAMQKFFPSFTIHQLPDGSGRLYWRGTVQPTGPGGIVWDVMLIYENNHPHTGEKEWGGSVRILPVNPRLRDLQALMPEGTLLPHVYSDYYGKDRELFICTADPRYFKGAGDRLTTAASALSWACKWMMLCEMWINGEIGDDLAEENNY